MRTWTRAFLVIGALFLACPVYAQVGGGVTSVGTITPGNCTSWNAVNVIQDAGTTCGGGGSVSITAGSSNIVVTPSPITGTGTVDLSTTPSVLSLTTTTLTTKGTNTLSALTTGALTVNGTGVVSSGTLANSFLTNSSLTISPGTGLTGGGSVALGAVTTLSLSSSSLTVNTNGVGLSGGGSVALGAVTTINGLYASTTVSGMSACGSGLSCSSTGVMSVTSTGGTVASPTSSLQYNNGGAFGGATGLYYSTTRLGIDFLANVTTANLISMGASGIDTTAVAVGPNALLGQTSTGTDNTAIGGFALTAVTTGIQNTALGYQAGKAAIVTGGLTALGYNAGLLTTGSNNTILGTSVGSVTLVSGASNIYIGNSSAIDATTSSTSNELKIGNNATTPVLSAQNINTSTPLIQLGGTSALNITATNSVGIGTANAAVNLTVSGTNNSTIQAVSNNTTGTSIDIINTSGGGHSFSFFSTGTGNAAGSGIFGAYDNTIGGTSGNILSITTTANGEVRIGANAGHPGSTNTGTFQSIIGASAGAALTTGSSEVLFGYKAGNLVTTGGNNTILGASVGSTVLTTGSGNILIGTDNTTTVPLAATTSAVSIGTGVKAGNGDTGVGFGALLATITNANDNTAIGFQALTAVTTGTLNTAVGYQAGKAITVSQSNTTIGASAGKSYVAGPNGMTAIGYNALGASTSGLNTAIGFEALQTVTTGAANTAVGNLSLSAVTNNTSNNTAVGDNTGLIITTGGANTILGAQVGSTVLTIGTNNILIGTNNAITSTTSSASNEIHIGGTGGDWVTVTGTNTNTTASVTGHGSWSLPDTTSSTSAQTGTLCWSSTSVTYDPSLGCLTSTRENKTNIVSFSGGLAEIMKMKPVSFFYKDQKLTPGEQLGLIAEDVLPVDKRLVGYGSDGKLRGIKYEGDMDAVLISAIQEQQKEIDDLKKQLKK